MYTSQTEFTFFSSMSKKRAVVIAVILIVALLVSVGLGIGLGLKNNESTHAGPTNSPVVEASTLEVAPSSSKEGTYRFAAVAADAAECSEIGT